MNLRPKKSVKRLKQLRVPYLWEMTSIRKSATFLILNFLIIPFSWGQSDPLLIRNINVIDVETGSTSSMDVMCHKGKITHVGTEDLVHYADEIDGRGKYLIPGLIDAHIHLFQSASVYTRPDALDLTEYVPYAAEQEWVRSATRDFLQRHLQCGVTTVYDLGGPIGQLRMPFRSPEPSDLPNLYITGPLASPYQPPALAGQDPPIVEVQTEQEAVDLLNAQKGYEPDFVKIWYLHGDDWPADASYTWVKALIDSSHALGMKVAVHATQKHTAELAIKAGADFLAHSVDDELIDSRFVQLMKKHDVGYIPTLTVRANYYHTYMGTQKFQTRDLYLANPLALSSYYDLRDRSNDKLDRSRTILEVQETYMQRLAKGDSIMHYNLRVLSKAGIRIATGTDAGNIGTHHGSSYFHELIAMHNAGMSLKAVLKASTIDAAHILGLNSTIGSVTEGKWADLLVLGSNPLKDINAYDDILYVIKGGEAWEPDRIVTVDHWLWAHRQLNAMLANDLNAYTMGLHTDVQFTIEGVPGQGKDAAAIQLSQWMSGKGHDKLRLQRRVIEAERVLDRIYFGTEPENSVIFEIRYTFKKRDISEIEIVRL